MHTISSLPPIGYIIAEYNPFFYPNLSKLSGCVFAIRILFGRFAKIIEPPKRASVQTAYRCGVLNKNKKCRLTKSQKKNIIPSKGKV